MSTYQPNIPTGTVDLDIDYTNIQGNFNQLNVQFGVDHIPLNNTTGTFPSGLNGIHTNIHFNPFSTTTSTGTNNYPVTPSGGVFAPGQTVLPSPTGGFGQLLSCQVNDGINTDEALYFLTGGGRPMQLTRNFQPAVGTNMDFPENGYTFLPGGFIIQWGTVALTTAPTVPVVFATSGNINFPANVFTAQLTAVRATAPGITIDISVSALTVNGFTINNDFPTGSPTNLAYYWWVIGN